MRVAIFTNTYHPTVNGVAHCVAAYREGLLARGVDVTVFAPAPTRYDRRRDPENVLRFPAVPVPMDVDYPIAMPYSRSVRKALQRMQFDVIHTQHPVWVGAWGAWYARWNELPLVSTVHTEYELFAPLVPLPTPLVEMYLRVRVASYCNKCQVVTTAVESTRRRLQEQGVAVPIEILPNPIRVAEFARADGASVRRRLGLDDEVVLIGFVGRLSPEKNLDVLLTAVGTVLHQAPQAAFVVVGDGPEMEVARNWAARLGASDRVFLVGALPHPDIPPYQAAIDIMVTASLSETQPLAHTEAMAAGTPVVALRAPGAEDMIDPGANGLLSEVPDGAGGLAENMLELVNNGDRRTQMGTQARRWAQRFDLESVTDRLLEIYEQAIDLGAELPL